MGKSLAEVHALERARWDALVPARFDPTSLVSERRSRDSLTGHLLAGVSDFLGELRGRRVVEYGCGLGDLTLRLAREGAHVTAVDLSPRSIEYVRRRAQDAGVAANVQTHVAAAERLPFFDESFDLAFGQAVLRCIAPELGAPELHRILRPAGRAVFFESLRGHAPARELEHWTAEFSQSEVRCLQIPSEPGRPGSDVWWRQLHASLLERLPRLGRSRRHAALLLTR